MLCFLHFTDTPFFTNWTFVATLYGCRYFFFFSPTAFAHLMSPSHVLVILIIHQYFKLFHYYVFCDPWSVNFDVRLVIVLGRREPCLYKSENLDILCALTASPTTFLISLPLLGPPYSLWHGSVRLGQLATLCWLPSVHGKENSHISQFQSKFSLIKWNNLDKNDQTVRKACWKLR